MLICPKCSEPLLKCNNSMVCVNKHTFDFSKEGYVNLLASNKKGNLIGDNKDMAKSRKSFLEKGYYSSLAEQLKKEYESLNGVEGAAVDICCGEGFYTQFISDSSQREFYGFDISKEMIRLAAKRKCQAQFFVANMTSIPIKSNSVAAAFHLFAPFCEKEFSRILKKDGKLISVSPGKKHLFELKKVLYDSPYENEEKLPECKGLILEQRKRVESEITLRSNEDIYSLFKMTPYYYHTNKNNKEKLDSINTLTTGLDFIIDIFSKTEEQNEQDV